MLDFSISSFVLGFIFWIVVLDLQNRFFNLLEATNRRTYKARQKIKKIIKVIKA